MLNSKNKVENTVKLTLISIVCFRGERKWEWRWDIPSHNNRFVIRSGHKLLHIFLTYDWLIVTLTLQVRTWISRDTRYSMSWTFVWSCFKQVGRFQSYAADTEKCTYLWPLKAKCDIDLVLTIMSLVRDTLGPVCVKLYEKRLSGFKCMERTRKPNTFVWKGSY